MAAAPRPNPLHGQGNRSFMVHNSMESLDNRAVWDSYSVMPETRNQDSVFYAETAAPGSRPDGNMAWPNGHQAVSITAAQQILEEKFTMLNSSLIATRDYALATLRHLKDDLTVREQMRPIQIEREQQARSGAPSGVEVVDMPQTSAVVPIPPNGSAPSISELTEDVFSDSDPITAIQPAAKPMDAVATTAAKPMDAVVTTVTTGRQDPNHWAGLRAAYKVKPLRTQKNSMGHSWMKGSIVQAVPTKRFTRQSLLRKFSRQARNTLNSTAEQVHETQSKRHSVRRGIFGDVESLKQKVIEATHQKEYNVMDKYKTSGYAQMIARSPAFDTLTLVVIFCHALWIGIDCELNTASVITKSPIGFQVVEHFFCLFFFFEWLVRFIAFEHKADGFRDMWFVFDTAMVVPMLLDTWLVSIIALFSLSDDEDGGLYGDATIIRLIRMLRLTRVCRVARLLNAIPEVMILIKGAMVAARSVILTLGLLGVIIYVFSIAFVQLTRGVNVGNLYFSSILEAMKTLLLNATFLEDIPDVYKQISRESEILGFFLLLYIFVASLTVMNMLVGVLVEVVSVVAAVEKETLVVNYVKSYLETVWAECGVDDRREVDTNARRSAGWISQDEFEQFLQHPDTLQCLSNVGVDVVGLVDLGNFLFREGDVSFSSFVEAVLALRGSLNSKVRDVVDLRKFIILELEDLEYKANLRNHAMLDHVMRLEGLFDRMVTEVKKTSPSPEEETKVETIDVNEAWA